MRFKIKSLLSLLLVAGLALSFGEGVKSTSSPAKATEKSVTEKNSISMDDKANCEKDTTQCPKMADCPKGQECPKDHHCEKNHHCDKSGHEMKDCKGKMHSKKEDAKSTTK